MFKHGFPALFSAAHIVPLFKKGERKDPANYRGIAIISILAKLYATALNQSLMSALEQHQTARAEAQSGFRPQRSTTEQIWSLQQVIDRARSAMPGGRLYCCFVDFSKAFDSVPRPLLWQTLRKLGVRAEYVDAISSYYANVDMCVRFDDGSYSDPFPSVLGVKQGCPLSPTLFGLFIDQLWSRLENSRITNLDKHHTSNLPCSLFYADDLVLIGFTPTELQRLLNELARFCKDTRMAVNLAKTQVVVFRPRRELQSPPQFKFRGQPVALVDSYRYLGFAAPAWKAPHQHGLPVLLSAAQRAAHWLRHRLHALGIRDLPTALQLFDMYIRPIALYASELWLPFLPDALRLSSDLERLQLGFLKHFLHLPPSTPSGPLLWETGRLPLFSAALTQLHSFLNRLAADPKRLGKNASITKDYRHMLLEVALDETFRTKVGSWSNRFYSAISTIIPVPPAPDSITPQKRIDNIASSQYYGRARSAVEEYARTQLRQTFTPAPDRALGSMHAWYGIHAAYEQHQIAPYLAKAPSAGNRDRLCRLRLGVLATDVRRQRLLGITTAHRTPCPLCDSGQPEDEEHFLFHCPAYSELRPAFSSLFPLDTPSLRSLLQTDSFTELGLFLSRSLPLRSTLLLLTPQT